MVGEGDSNQPLPSVDVDDEGGGETVSVNIKSLNGTKFTVKTSLDSTVESFKEIVAQSSDVPANQQRLIYKGRILKDYEPLLSYGLQADHTVHMVRVSAPPAAISAPSVTLVESLFPGLFGDGLLDLEQLAQNLNMRRDMIMSDPRVREVVDRNPEIGHMLTDPSVIRQNLEAARNPELMREMSRNKDRAMSNIESMPGGFDFLRRMYENVHKPLFNATTMSGDTDSDPFAALLRNERVNTHSSAQNAGTGNSIPNADPLPNPWSFTGGQTTSPVRTNSGWDARSPDLGGSVVAPPQAMEAGSGGQFGTTSLYIGDLDVSVTDSRLFDVFRDMGQVVSVRVCRDSATRRSLGYGYVSFTNPQDAERAIRELNCIPLNGKPIRVMYSRRDPSGRCSGPNGAGKIFIKNLDKSIDQLALHDRFSTFGNIISCKVAVDSSGKSKGYGFVQYETEESAQRAMAQLNGMLLNDKKVYVRPFLRRQERVSTANKTTFTNVYVKNLVDSTTDDDLKNAFGEFGIITSAVVMKDGDGKSKGFGFVNFDNADDAAKAVKSLNGKTFDDKEWYVGRAQKKSEKQNKLKVRYKQMNLQQPLVSQNRNTTSQDPGQTGIGTGTGSKEGMALLMNIFGSLVPPEERYETQLKQLEEMGFYDRAENINALLATSGNVNAAVERLLGSIGQQSQVRELG